MPVRFAIGDLVEWRWYGFLVEGTVEEIFLARTTKTIKGSKIVRKGSPQNPAYVVRSNAGNIALKLGSELHLRSKIFSYGS